MSGYRIARDGRLSLLDSGVTATTGAGPADLADSADGIEIFGPHRRRRHDLDVPRERRRVARRRRQRGRPSGRLDRPGRALTARSGGAAGSAPPEQRLVGVSPRRDDGSRRRVGETRRMSHAHVHAPHELTEGPEGSGPGRAERRLELGAVLLLALTTVATAWCGYQAARWSGEQSQSYARASATRVKAQQAATQAGQLRIDDLLYFNEWLDARRTGDERLAAIYRRRFRPEFVPAFRAWIAQRPFTNPRAIPGPLYMPQYRPADLARSTRLDAAADRLYEEGTTAKDHDDRYILATVFFAAVLFFAGISLRLDWRPLRVAILGLALAMLLGGVGFVLTLPVA
jgi:hypothetical protein